MTINACSLVHMGKIHQMSHIIQMEKHPSLTEYGNSSMSWQQCKCYTVRERGYHDTQDKTTTYMYSIWYMYISCTYKTCSSAQSILVCLYMQSKPPADNLVWGNPLQFYGCCNHVRCLAPLWCCHGNSCIR